MKLVDVMFEVLKENSSSIGSPGGYGLSDAEMENVAKEFTRDMRRIVSDSDHKILIVKKG